MASYKITLSKVSRTSDFKGAIIALQKIGGLTRAQAIEKLKNLPSTLVHSASEPNARKIVNLFADLGVVVTVAPPLPTEHTPLPPTPIPQSSQRSQQNSAEHSTQTFSIVLVSAIILTVILLLIGGSLWIVQHSSTLRELVQTQSLTTQQTKQLPPKKQKRVIDRKLQEVIQSINAVRHQQNLTSWQDYGGTGDVPEEGTDLLPHPELNNALQTLTSLQSVDSTQPDIYRWKGFIYQEKGMAAQAEQQYRKALQLDSTNVIYWNLLATALLDQQKPAQADYFFRKALSLDSANSNTVKNLAITNLHHLQDSAKALLYLQYYISLEPENDFDYLSLRKEAASLAWNMYNQSQLRQLFNPITSFAYYEQRRVQLTNQIAQGKHIAQSHEELGLLYLRKGMAVAGETELEKSRAADPSRASIYSVLALLQAHKQQFDQALGTLNRGIDNVPKPPSELIRNKGLLLKYYKASFKDSAQLLLQYLRTLPPNSQEYANIYAEIAQAQNMADGKFFHD